MSSHIKQTGFVSIIVASLLMVILALITVGFTRIMQREQRQALDRQLSRQALYAAESGINDVLDAIDNDLNLSPTADYTGISKASCDVNGLGPHGNGNLSGPADDTIAYTCALFNQQPGSLKYDLDIEDSKIVELRTASTNNFESVEITWGNPGGNNLVLLPDCGDSIDLILQNPPNPSNRVSTVRFDLTRIAGSYDRGNMLADTEYLYLVPCYETVPSAYGTHSFDPTSRGDAIPVPCSGGGAEPCRVVIDGLLNDNPLTGVADATNRMFARVRPLYESAQLSMSAQENTGAGPVPAQFTGAQISVDVTAKSNDVVRRLSASVPFESSVEVPEVALQVFNGICKRLDIINETPGSENVVDNCAPPIPPGCTTNEFFSLGDYAATLGDPTDRRYALDSVWWDAWPGPGFSPNHHPVSDPHIPISVGITIDPTCSYEVDYLAFCSYVDPQDPPPKDPDCNNGGFNQELETARVEFYGDYSGVGSTLTCDLTMPRGFADIPDSPSAAGGWPEVKQWSGTVPVQNIVAGDVRCLRLVHMCQANPASIPECDTTINIVRQGSVHIEEILWRGF